MIASMIKKSAYGARMDREKDEIWCFGVSIKEGKACRVVQGAAGHGKYGFNGVIFFGPMQGAAGVT